MNLPAIILALIPAFVAEAEKLFNADSPDHKHAWVKAAVYDIVEFGIQKWVPVWARPGAEELEKLIEDAIQAAVDKIPETKKVAEVESAVKKAIESGGDTSAVDALSTKPAK